MVDTEKEIIYIEGIISYFNYKEPFNKDNKPSLHCKGVDEGDQELSRTIKISKYVKGYDKENKILLRQDYPLYDHIYKGTLQLETWLWNGHQCMRVIAFKILDDLGVNQYLQNPFE